jgi:hypothetical protein
VRRGSCIKTTLSGRNRREQIRPKRLRHCLRNTKFASTIVVTDTMGTFLMIGPDPMIAAAQQQVEAAWLQAYAAIAQTLLTIAAIGVAVYVPWRAQKMEAGLRNRRERTLARDIAMQTTYYFEDWRNWAEQRLTIVDNGVEGALNIVQLMQGDADLLQPPNELGQYRGALREFGDAAISVQSAFIAADRFFVVRPRALALGVAISQGKCDEIALLEIASLARDCIHKVIAADKKVAALLKDGA